MNELLDLFSLYDPATLTASVKLIAPDEPYLLTNRLGRSVKNAATEEVRFEVETRSQRMAPLS
jgi:hypothetical protein